MVRITTFVNPYTYIHAAALNIYCDTLGFIVLSVQDKVRKKKIKMIIRIDPHPNATGPHQRKEDKMNKFVTNELLLMRGVVFSSDYDFIQSYPSGNGQNHQKKLLHSREKKNVILFIRFIRFIRSIIIQQRTTSRSTSFA